VVGCERRSENLRASSSRKKPPGSTIHGRRRGEKIERQIQSHGTSDGESGVSSKRHTDWIEDCCLREETEYQERQSGSIHDSRGGERAEYQERHTEWKRTRSAGWERSARTRPRSSCGSSDHGGEGDEPQGRHTAWRPSMTRPRSSSDLIGGDAIDAGCLI
jgi:hypothetical protein